MSGQDHSQAGGNEGEQKYSRISPYIWEGKGKHPMRGVENNRDLDYDSYSEPSTSSVQTPKCIDVKTPITDSVNCHFQNYLAGALELNESFRDGPDNWPMDEYIDMREPGEDCYMQHWHANQLARGFMDNTINTVLETWLTTPLDGDIMENTPFNSSNDRRIEDNPILMGTREYLSVNTFSQDNLLNSPSGSIKCLDNPIYLELDH